MPSAVAAARLQRRQPTMLQANPLALAPRRSPVLRHEKCCSWPAHGAEVVGAPSDLREPSPGGFRPHYKSFGVTRGRCEVPAGYFLRGDREVPAIPTHERQQCRQPRPPCRFPRPRSSRGGRGNKARPGRAPGGDASRLFSRALQRTHAGGARQACRKGHLSRAVRARAQTDLLLK